MEHWLSDTCRIVFSWYGMCFVFRHLPDTWQFVRIEVLFAQLAGSDGVPGREGMGKTPDHSGLTLRIPLIGVHNQSAIDSTGDLVDVNPFPTTYG